MPSPISPNDLKELLNDSGAALCDKFLNLIRRFPEMVYQILLYERNADGSISDAMKDDICALACAGGSGNSGGSALAAPTNLSATDGTLGDRIRLTWNFVSAATNYDIYRKETNSSEGASLIGNTTTTTFDDTTATPDTIYYYWVKARNDTQVSAFSSPDTGYISTALPAVSDLQASQGFSKTEGGSGVSLVWTPVTGAGAYDIYRNTVDSFSTATRIDSDRVPFDNSESLSTGPSPLFVDNGGELLYTAAVPAGNARFYFWVVSKRTAPTSAVSPESNSALGWGFGWGDGLAWISAGDLTVSGQTITVPLGATKVWVGLFGNGAGGAGGGGVYGGGGGGGGAVAWGELAVAGNGVLKLLLTPSTTGGNAASATNAVAGSLSELQYQPPAGAFATKLSSSAAGGGLYNAAGSGAGGAASVAAATGMASSVLKNGRPGKPGAGEKGGRGGHRFGFLRTPGAHFNGFNAVTGHNGNSGAGGGGSYASPSSPTLATGGANSGLMASVVFVFRA